jgi:hypothetical protein
LPENAMALYLGNSRLTASTDTFPWSPLQPQDRRARKEYPIVTIEMDTHGRIAIDIDVRSKDHKIIARITRNQFVINTNNILSRSRPDRSTLIIYDQDGNEVLNIRYVNPHRIHLLGMFYVYGQDSPVVITENEQIMGAYGRVSSFCGQYAPGFKEALFASGDGSGNHEDQDSVPYDTRGNPKPSQ